jgi:hypothetical protein
MDYRYDIACIILLTILWLLIDHRIKRKHLSTSIDAATKALDKVSAWTTWISSLETAAIAAIGFLYAGHKATEDVKNYAFFTLLFFGSSILLATWLLCCTPSMQMRLNSKTGTSNDIYEMDIFQSLPLRFGSFSTLVHTYFVTGIIFFSLFIYAVINAPVLPVK